MVHTFSRPALALAILILAVGGPVDGSPTTTVADNSSRLPETAARFYAYVKQPLPGELGWQEIPWTLDLNEGIRLAKKEQRPVLLWVSGDDPLEKC